MAIGDWVIPQNQQLEKRCEEQFQNRNTSIFIFSNWNLYEVFKMLYNLDFFFPFRIFFTLLQIYMFHGIRTMCLTKQQCLLMGLSSICLKTKAENYETFEIPEHVTG